MYQQDFDLFAGTKQLLSGTCLKITHPNKYCLVGRNGTGKSSLLKYIADKYSDLDVYYVDQDIADTSNDSIKEFILKSNKERTTIKSKLSEFDTKPDLSTEEMQEYNTLQEQYRLYQQDEAIITRILRGLGFTHDQMVKNLNQFSGGWRMRISIARGLYMNPKYLLLDEPTNHLDLDGVIWLTNYLKKFKNCLVVVSHDKYFVDEICDNIIHLDDMKLHYYTCGYSNFEKVLIQKTNELQKKYDLQQKRIRQLKLKGFSGEKIIQSLGVLLEMPKKYKVNIQFPDPGAVNGSNIITLESVSFSYEDKTILENVDFCIDDSSRIVLVGRNGVGKSTLMKLLRGQIKPTSGIITRDARNKIYYYDQFSTIIMDENLTMVEYLKQVDSSLKIEEIRKLLGTIGFESSMHNNKIESLSGGQRMKLQFIPINIKKPHLLLLDEPTNNLDLESIDSLIEGINNFTGGVVVITHNVDLIMKISAQVKLITNRKIVDIEFDDYRNSIIDE